MRKNFAQVLKQANVDIKEEYHRLYDLFNTNIKGCKSLRKIIEDNFQSFWFRGTCLTIDEFDEDHDFYFGEYLDDVKLDDLVDFCEYLSNFIAGLDFSTICLADQINTPFYMEQIGRVVEKIGYMQSTEDGLVIFVEKSAAAIAVSEIIPPPLSYKVIFYNHHSMQGDLEAKKSTILQFSHLLEGQRQMLNKVNPALETDIFYLFNNLNLRHNNSDPSDKKKYKDCVAKMKVNELEDWYDETYQMCLLAFLELDNIERKKSVDSMKSKMSAEQKSET